MKSKKTILLLKKLLILFFLLDLYFIATSKNNFRFLTKPFLVPIIAILYYFQLPSHNQKANIIFLFGLIASTLGDLFLLFSWGFLPGLGSFLIAHIFYIATYNKILERKLKFLPLPFIFLIVYLLAFLYWLTPYLQELKVPVYIYAFVLTIMFYFALLTKPFVSIKPFRYLGFGAFLFVISDSVLAVDLFVKHEVFLSLVVMITYISAQYLLMNGVVIKTHESISK